jgi:2-amino-4-hydroxy-6-hydroxymethyldihydropteridine diphosphokinase
VIELDTLENQVKSVYLGIGSNLGDKKNNIEKSKFELIKKNILISQTSSYYESLSWPNQNNPRFLNIVVNVVTNLTPMQLIKKCKEIEVSLGRKKSAKNSPRVCDIDIIDYDKKITNGDVILPHPRMHTRNFVLLPLFQINKDWTHPSTKQHIKKLILSLPNKEITSIKQI